jgi:cytochrome c5
MKVCLVLGVALAGALALGACSSSPFSSSGDDDEGGGLGGGTAPPGAAANPDYENPRSQGIETLPDPLEGLPRGQAQLDIVCARGARDAVAAALCSRKPITSLRDLQEAVGLGFQDRSENGRNSALGNPGFAMLGHSTSLVAREVSAINPRVFIFNATPGRPERIPGFTVMGFTRGDPFVEFAAEDKDSGKLNLYLVKFDLACEATKTCKPGDLLTPSVEEGWQGISLYDDEDLKNTLVDCRHCHQPGGPTSPKILRMQELKDPWTHWLRKDRPGGIALLGDFLRAHGDQEDYGGIPAAIIQKTDGRALEDFVVGQGFGEQPNAFQSEQIEQEVSSSQSTQPDVNIPAGTSSTWQSIYGRAAAGEAIPVPYHDVKVTDPDKLQFATNAYKAVMAGTADKASMPDIRRVFLEDALEELTFRPKKGATGKEVLVQTCAQCHRGGLDPSISRAGFDVTKLDTMPRPMKDKAIERLKLPGSNRLHMPPSAFRALPDDALKSAIDELSK